jgi:hypothetical protein
MARGRKPIGIRAMSSTERSKRHLAKLAAAARAEGAAESGAPVAGAVPINVDSLNRWPDLVAPWLVQRINRRAREALRDALDGVPDEEDAE